MAVATVVSQFLVNTLIVLTVLVKVVYNYVSLHFSTPYLPNWAQAFRRLDGATRFVRFHEGALPALRRLFRWFGVEGESLDANYYPQDPFESSRSYVDPQDVVFVGSCYTTYRNWKALIILET